MFRTPAVSARRSHASIFGMSLSQCLKICDQCCCSNLTISSVSVVVCPISLTIAWRPLSCVRRVSLANLAWIEIFWT